MVSNDVISVVSLLLLALTPDFGSFLMINTFGAGNVGMMIIGGGL